MTRTACLPRHESPETAADVRGQLEHLIALVGWPVVRRAFSMVEAQHMAGQGQGNPDVVDDQSRALLGMLWDQWLVQNPVPQPIPPPADPIWQTRFNAFLDWLAAWRLANPVILFH